MYTVGQVYIWDVCSIHVPHCPLLYFHVPSIHSPANRICICLPLSLLLQDQFNGYNFVECSPSTTAAIDIPNSTAWTGHDMIVSAGTSSSGLLFNLSQRIDNSMPLYRNTGAYYHQTFPFCTTNHPYIPLGYESVCLSQFRVPCLDMW